MIIHSSDGKTTYGDGDSLSGDLGEKVRNGDKDALQKLKEFAANKDPEQPHSQARALYELAEVHFNGLCEVKRSLEEALKFLIQAVELDDDHASVRLGEFYRDGKQGFKQDGQKALELFLKAAEHGNKNGLRLAAEMFREGQGGFKADGYRAIEFYEKLDALDDKQALMSIAEIYTEGCGRLKPNGQKALDIYEDIILHSEYWVKIDHDFGISSPRRYNYGNASFQVAEIYLEGKAGVKPDGYKSIEYLSEAIRRNEKDSLFFNPLNAMKTLAEIYRYGKAGVAQDGQKAVEYLTCIAENDDSEGLFICGPNEAFYELGNIYAEGCGEIVPDLQKAIDFYQKSAKLGYNPAEMKLKELLSQL